MAASTGSASKNSLQKTTPVKLAGIDLHGNVAPFGECLGHLPASGAQLDHGEAARLAEFAIQLADARGHQNSEDGPHLLRRVEISVLAERVARTPVVSVPGVVERRLHEAAKRNGTVAEDLRRQQFPQRPAHLPHTLPC
jgi:hypothetical protein